VKNVIFLLIIVMITFSCSGNIKSEYIYSHPDNSFINAETMLNELDGEKIIIFGEIHDDSFTHYMEHYIYAELLKNNDYLLGLEMFERDVQQVVNQYINNTITEETFLEQSRPWGNYNDYRPLVETAKINKKDIIALNVPRYIAASIAKKGIHYVDSFPSELVERYTDFSEDYRDAFSITMAAVQKNSPMGMIMSDSNLFAAQLLKDATMANSILNTIEKQDRIFVLCGQFHSNYDMGIIDQLRFMGFTENIISIAVIDSVKHLDMDMADYIIVKELYEF